MSWKTLCQMDLHGKRVLTRVDLNVPMVDGKIADATRIEKIVPTINEITKKGGIPILLAHMGRPKGKRHQNLSLRRQRQMCIRDSKRSDRWLKLKMQRIQS